MIYRDTLYSLRKHQIYLQETLGRDDIFFVGGCVRDLLLHITDEPSDIDITMPGKPETIRENMLFNEDTMSRFRTEKYGTMTILPRNEEQEISYEITPLRTEGGYTDNRHPEEITRSDSITQDSKRRDFTINALYRYGIDTSLYDQEKKPKRGEKHIAPALQKKENIFLTDYNILVIQQEKDIQKRENAGYADSKILQDIADAASYIEISINNRTPKKTAVIIDMHGGCKDILAGKIKAVGDAKDRFNEDALRILRGIRFPNTLNQHIPENTKQHIGFDIEKKTWEAMQEKSELVSHLAKERLHEELKKIFMAGNAFGYVCLLDELQLIPILFPELAACKGNEQPIRYHPFDTYIHTLLTLHAFEQGAAAENDTKYLAKLAMLYHDIGKPAQYAYIAEQKKNNPDEIDMSGYVHHSETGAETASQAFSRLGFSKKECTEISWYIRLHHRPGEILESNEKNRLKKMRKLLSEGGLEKTLHLIDITIADRNGQYNPLQPAAVQELYAMKETISELHTQEGRFTLQDLAINGTDVISFTEGTPGPHIGVLLSQCFDRVLSDIKTRNTKKKLLTHLKTLVS